MDDDWDDDGPGTSREVNAPGPDRVYCPSVAMSTLFDIYGYLDRDAILWRLGDAWEANAMLSRHHYLGPLHSGARMVIVGEAPHRGEPVAAMMWKHPTSRGLPSDGSWLELSRWCLTPSAGDNAGSRMHKWAVRLIREHLPQVTTLVSYSDPTHGHTGALYRACNWQWAPTWHRLRPAPSGHGDWGTGRQGVKDRWVFCVRPDRRRADVLAVDDAAAVRHWQKNATPAERAWAKRSLNLVDVNPPVVGGVDGPGPGDVTGAAGLEVVPATAMTTDDRVSPTADNAAIMTGPRSLGTGPRDTRP